MNVMRDVTVLCHNNFIFKCIVLSTLLCIHIKPFYVHYFMPTQCTVHVYIHLHHSIHMPHLFFELQCKICMFWWYLLLCMYIMCVRSCPNTYMVFSNEHNTITKTYIHSLQCTSPLACKIHWESGYIRKIVKWVFQDTPNMASPHKLQKTLLNV
jgi:hypothetical protein